MKNGDRELQTAYDMGLLSLLSNKEIDETITYKECSMLLYHMISLLDKSAAAKWKEQESLCFTSERPMKRDDAMLLFYSAAKTLGWPTVVSPEDFHLTPEEWNVLKESLHMFPVSAPKNENTVISFTNSDFEYLSDLYHSVAIDDYRANYAWDYPCFSDGEYSDVTGWGMAETTFCFVLGLRSYISNQTILDFDKEEVYLHLDEDLTIGAAVRAVVRLSESVSTYADTSVTETIRQTTDARRDAILDSPTAIEKASEYIPGKTYCETAYYVSNDGNDENDGLTPKTAFRTVQKVNLINLQKGDAVFFRRGDIWREFLCCKNGVTYSAYGEGRKPRFYGSKESGVGEEKWSLYHTGPNGEKIWKYHCDMPDTGSIVFNDGESYALRAYSWWSAEEKSHVRIEDVSRPFLPEERLLEGMDLTFCSLVDFGDKGYPIIRYNHDDRGKLYLRCDKGNPGTLYHDIEFENSGGMENWFGTGMIGWFGILEGDHNAAEMVLDNLAVMYWGNRAIGSGDTTKKMIVQNCEIAWGGNSLHMITQSEPTTTYMLSGDGIYAGGESGMKVSNCYCHDIDGAGITSESSSTPSSGLDVTENLIEHCGQGVTMHNGGEALSQPILVENNIIWDIGVGNVHGCFCPHSGISMEAYSRQMAPITIRGNLICHTMHAPILGLTGQETLENNQLYR